jgi:hypothetical protein
VRSFLKVLRRTSGLAALLTLATASPLSAIAAESPAREGLDLQAVSHYGDALFHAERAVDQVTSINQFSRTCSPPTGPTRRSAT